MQIKTYENVFGKPLVIRDLVDCYTENAKTGQIQAFGRKLNVRPEYQRTSSYRNCNERIPA